MPQTKQRVETLNGADQLYPTKFLVMCNEDLFL